ncbi:MAG: mechanosensitive ion channel [Deltaproteobacteria bacterium]|jgi:hypothetical protein|nr:mechanosensitive ion channel [Deltaproteobacteria bacterium]
MVLQPINITSPATPPVNPMVALQSMPITAAPQVQTTMPTAVVASPPRQPGFFTRLCIGAGAFFGTGVPVAIAQQAVAPQNAAAAQTAADKIAPSGTRQDIVDHLSNFPLQSAFELGAVIGGAIILHKALGKAIKVLELDTQSTGKSYVRRGLRLFRSIMWGGAAYLGYKILGLNHADIILGVGGGAALVALTSRSLLTRFGSSLSVATRGDLEMGDYLEMWDGKGRMIKQTPTRIVLKSRDQHGAVHVTTVPIETYAGRTSDETYPDEDFLRSLEIGHYISFGGTLVGQIASKDELSIGIRQEDALGGIHIHHIDVRQITEDSVVNHGEYIPSLPDGVDIGDTIELDAKKGKIMKFNEWYVWIETEEKVTYKIPRTEFKKTWSLVTKKAIDKSDVPGARTDGLPPADV